jgi:hypothetical protein
VEGLLKHGNHSAREAFRLPIKRDTLAIELLRLVVYYSDAKLDIEDHENPAPGME